MTERIVETSSTPLPHRMIRPAEPESDGSFRWIVEYDQTERGDWSFRGIIHEVDGVFLVRDERIESAERALVRFARRG